VGREATTSDSLALMVIDHISRAFMACLRPFGYLAFVIALAALSLAARLLGEEHALGYFAGRLSETIRRYPEVTRRGVQMAWLTWAVLLTIAISPWDPITSRWDEIVLLALAAGAVWRRHHGRSQVGS
jgi:hypothetical protein